MPCRLKTSLLRGISPRPWERWSRASLPTARCARSERQKQRTRRRLRREAGARRPGEPVNASEATLGNSKVMAACWRAHAGGSSMVVRQHQRQWRAATLCKGVLDALVFPPFAARGPFYPAAARAEDEVATVPASQRRRNEAVCARQMLRFSRVARYGDAAAKAPDECARLRTSGAGMLPISHHPCARQSDECRPGTPPAHRAPSWPAFMRTVCCAHSAKLNWLIAAMNRDDEDENDFTRIHSIPGSSSFELHCP